FPHLHLHSFPTRRSSDLTTVRGIQSFLGFCNFYRRFIKDYSRIAKPLNCLTRKDVSFAWTDKCQQVFEELKKRLTDAPILRHYRSEEHTSELQSRFDLVC